MEIGKQIIISFFTLVATTAFGASANSSPSITIASNNSIESSTSITLNSAAPASGFQTSDNNDIALTINANDANAECIKISSTNGGLTLDNSDAVTSTVKKIELTFTCPTITDTNSGDISATTFTTSSAGTGANLYTVAADKVVYDQQPSCAITSSENLTAKIAGSYGDTITFSIGACL